MVEENRSNDNPYPVRSRVWTPCREWAAHSSLVVVPYSREMNWEEVVEDKWLVERQAGAAVADVLDYPDRIASHSIVADLLVPVALRFPLLGSKKCNGTGRL